MVNCVCGRNEVPQDFTFANDRHFAAPNTFVVVAASEKIIKSPARKSSPQLRRKSIASPIRRDSGSDNNRSLADRRISAIPGVHTPECDMVDMTNEGNLGDMRVGQSRIEGRDDNGGGGMQQPRHDPFSASNVPTSNPSSSIGYATSFVSQPELQQTSPQDQTQYMPELGIRNDLSGYYVVNTPSQGPVLRRGNTMPSVPQSSGASVHHGWVYSQYSPGSTPSHTPYGPPRQSGGSPTTSVTGGAFQSLQLPPPPPNPNHQQPQLGHRPSHHNLGGDGSGGGSGGHQQYDASVSLNAQMGGGHAGALGYTDFLRSELSHEDGNGRPVKME